MEKYIGKQLTPELFRTLKDQYNRVTVKNHGAPSKGGCGCKHKLVLIVDADQKIVNAYEE
jgi:hypothetical protein